MEESGANAVHLREEISKTSVAFSENIDDSNRELLAVMTKIKDLELANKELMRKLTIEQDNSTTHTKEYSKEIQKGQDEIAELNKTLVSKGTLINDLHAENEKLKGAI